MGTPTSLPPDSATPAPTPAMWLSPDMAPPPNMMKRFAKAAPAPIALASNAESAPGPEPGQQGCTRGWADLCENKALTVRICVIVAGVLCGIILLVFVFPYIVWALVE